MKLPEKLTYGTETSSGSGMLETKQAINQLIDYLAERDKKEAPVFEGPEDLTELLHQDTIKSLNKHTPDIEGIVEEFNEKFDDIFECDGQYRSWSEKKVTQWLRSTLQSQADQYERERIEAYAQGWNEGQQALKEMKEDLSE